MNLQEITKKLLMLRSEIQKVEEHYQKIITPLKEERDKLQSAILEELQKQEQYSIRFKDYTISRAVRKTPKVIDENKIINQLKELGLDKEYTRLSLNDNFKALARQAIKEGKLFEGLEVEEREYISISQAKKEERRKVNVE